MDFSPRFREFRETAPGILGISFEEILQKCGIAENDYRYYEQGLKSPLVEHLFSLCRECRLDINWLFGHENSMIFIKGAGR
jgi:transcriptional regulator with XRE-family HTH domain